ncbi:MAG: aminotransferase class IV [Planctomycetota bacterium]|jgi:D-amino acid aminotransferase
MAKVFLNDKILDDAKAHISVSDSGFLYGMGLFETMRCTGGKVFALGDHLARLSSSAKELAISNPYDTKYVANAIGQTLEANNLTDARLRLTLTNGPMAQGDGAKATLLITATRFEPYPDEYYQKGVGVVLTDFRQNTQDPIVKHKTTNYFSRLLALNVAHQKKAAEALWFTTDGRLAEGCVSNIFCVKDSALYTPTLDTPVLPGIMRKTVCDIAKAESIELVEKDLTIKELLAADEVFLTNVIMLILPVVGVEAHTVGDGKVGPITKKLTESVKKII